MDSARLWGVIVICAVATYLWRGLGVMFSERIRPDSAVFAWVGCVAYAIILGLTTRIVLMPSGALAETMLSHRLLACAVGLIVYFASRRNLLLGTLSGVSAFAIAAQIQAAA
ncbi:MAG: AzlD domain-containing protein [Burkholderiales bacterium]|nr:AzlD domain-containing protein [Burkholderiales bacterium]